MSAPVAQNHRVTYSAPQDLLPGLPGPQQVGIRVLWVPLLLLVVSGGVIDLWRPQTRNMSLSEVSVKCSRELPSCPHFPILCQVGHGGTTDVVYEWLRLFIPLRDFIWSYIVVFPPAPKPGSNGRLARPLLFALPWRFGCQSTAWVWRAVCTHLRVNPLRIEGERVCYVISPCQPIHKLAVTVFSGITY